MRITIHGGSDDLVETDVGGEQDEHQHPGPGLWLADLTAPDGDGLTVHVFFDGLWHVGVGQLFNQADPDADGMPLPTWPCRFHVPTDTRYATALSVECPDGTALSNIRTWR